MNKKYFLAVPILFIAVEIYLLAIQFIGIYNPLPWHDEWATVNFLINLKNNFPYIDGFFSLHNEHRLFFPRIIYAIDFFIFHGLNIFTYSFSILLFIGINLIISKVIITYKVAGQYSILLALALVAFLLTGQQLSNFLWAFQVQWFITNFFSIYSIYVFSTKTSNNKLIFIIAYISAIIATFSTASGIFIWPSLFAIGLIRFKNLPRSLLLSTFLCGFLSTIIYFYNFSFSGIAINGISNNLSISKAFIFLLAYIGTPFAPFGYFLPFLMGSLMLVLVFIISVRLYKKNFYCSATETFCIGVLVFVLSTALVVSLGRYNLGISSATESRFASITSIGWAAVFIYFIEIIYSIDCKFSNKYTALFLTLLFSITGLMGYLNPPYNYSDALIIKTNAINDIYEKNYDSENLRILGFYNNQKYLQALDFLSESKANIFYKNQIKFQALEKNSVFEYHFNVDSYSKKLVTYGLYAPESFGSWSNGKIILIKFPEKLPNRFHMSLILGGYAMNINNPLHIYCGPIDKSILIDSEIYDMKSYSVDFEDCGDVDYISLLVFKPTRPSLITNKSSDNREIGIAIQSLHIEKF